MIGKTFFGEYLKIVQKCILKGVEEKMKMKKLMAGILSCAMLVTAAPLIASADDGFSLEKYNWAEGTQITVTDTSFSENVTYRSSNDAVVKISADGTTITAAGAGDAEITPYVGDIAKTPLPVHVIAKTKDSEESNITDDIASGALNFQPDYWGTPVMGDSIKDGQTKLIAYVGDGALKAGSGANEGYIINNHSTRTGFQGYVYKVDGELSSVTLKLITYNSIYKEVEPQTITDRLSLGYITDEDASFNYNNKTYTWKDWKSMTGYPISAGVSTYSDGIPVKMNSTWTKVDVSNPQMWKKIGDNTGAPYKYEVTAKIPSDAKYICAFLLIGQDENGKTTDPVGAHGYRGLTFNYKTEYAGEINGNIVSVTYGENIGADALAVTVNGEAADNNVFSYDANAYTAYVDGSKLSGGDVVKVSSEYGDYTAVIPGGSEKLYDSASFAARKTALTAGTSTGIDAVITKNGVDVSGAVTVKYTSSNPSAATVDKDGKITAVAAGTALITPKIGAEEFPAIEITVYGGNVVLNDLYDDITNNKIIDINAWRDGNGAIPMSGKRNGTSLWAYAYRPADVVTNDSGAGHEVYMNSGAREGFMAFIYKPESAVSEFEANLRVWGSSSQIERRTTIAYMTEEQYAASGINLEGSASVYDAEAAVAVNTDGVYSMKSIWTAVDKTFAQDQGADGRVQNFKTFSIPADAKYVLLFVNLSTLEDGTALPEGTGAVNTRMMNVKMTYKPALAAGELLSDNRAALTFTGAIDDRTVTVKKNGAVVENPSVTYDADNLTLYVDGGFTSGDSVEIITAYGTWTGGIKDDRVQLTAVALDDGEGSINEPYAEMEQVNASVTVANAADGAKVTAYAALYDSEGRLVKIAHNDAVSAGGTATATAALAFGRGLVKGDVIRVFAWNAQLMPYANYKNIVTEFVVTE